MSQDPPSDLALFWAAVIAISILVYVILDGFDLGVGHPLRHHARREPPPAHDGHHRAVLGRQRDLAGDHRRRPVRDLSGGLRRVPGGVLPAGAAAARRPDLSRHRLRISLPQREDALAVGHGILSRIDRGRLRAGGGRGRADARPPGGERPVRRHVLRMAASVFGPDRHRPRVRLRAAGRGLDRAQERRRSARLGLSPHPVARRGRLRGPRPGFRRVVDASMPARSRRAT